MNGLRANRKNLIAALALFIVFLVSVFTVHIKSFGIEAGKQESQSLKSDISGNSLSGNAQVAVSIGVGLVIILLGIILSYQLMIDPCHEDTKPESGKDGGVSIY